MNPRYHPRPLCSLLCLCIVLSASNILRAQQAPSIQAKELLSTAKGHLDSLLYERAAIQGEKALALFEASLGYEHLQTSNALQLLGKIELERGHFDRAKNNFTKALAIRKERQDKPDSLIIETLIALGQTSEGKGNLSQAMTYLEEALQLQKASLGVWHRYTGIIYMRIGVVHDLNGAYEEALQWHFKAEKVFSKVLPSNAQEWAILYGCIGIVYDFKGELNLALDFQQKALDILQAIYPEKHAQTANCYNNIGILHRRKGDYLKALQYQEKALQIRLALHGKKHPNVGASLNNLGVIHRHMGELDEALEYFHQALHVRKSIFGDNHRRVASSYENIASIYKEREEIDQALQYTEKALQIRQSLWQGNHPDLAVSFRNLASLYSIKEEYPIALAYLAKAQKMWGEIYGFEHPTTATVLDIQGKVYRKMQAFDRALPVLRESLQLRKEIFGEQHPATANSYDILGRLYKDLAQFDSAKHHLQTAISIRLDLQERDHFLLMNHYYHLSEIYYGEEHYLLAAEWADKAIHMLDQMRCRYLSSGTKQAHLSQHYYIFENAIKVYLKLATHCPSEGYDQLAFRFAEKAKSNLLLESFKNIQAQSFAGIPDHLLEQEYELGIELSYYQQKRFQEANQAHPKDSLLSQFNNKIFDLRKEREALIRQFEASYPDYFRLKYDTGVSDVSTIQKQLNADQTLLEYFIGDEDIYVFLISAEDYRVKRIKKNFSLSSLIEELREGITSYYQFGERSEAQYDQGNHVFLESAHCLYETIFQPLGPLSKELLIVPDGVLGHLPFEILLKEIPSSFHHFKTHSYLIHDYTIGYNFSATLWQLMKEKSYTSKGLLSIAPSFRQQTRGLTTKGIQRELGPLLHNGTEVAAIQSLYKGKNLHGPSATLSQFKEHAPEYKYLHLATHAQLEDRDINYSFLAFSPAMDSTQSDKLFIRDLYNLRLPCDMVVLSACETGVGKWQSGEGIVSLARGFAYAGAKSIVTSLWSANDQSTAQIMALFYTNLKEGFSKKEALRQAKLHYLSTQKDPLNTHPFFWATFVPIGDLEQSITTANHASTSWLWCGLLLLICLVAPWFSYQLNLHLSDPI